MMAAKVMDVIARLPDCDGQAELTQSPRTLRALREPEDHKRQCQLTPRENGGCSKVAQNSDVRVSRCLDTSCKTQVAEIIG